MISILAATPSNETMVDQNVSMNILRFIWVFKSSKFYNMEILSAEILVVRRYRHGRMIVVFPIYILGLASLAIFMIPVETGER